jgi:hypothetical protein
MSLKAKSLSNIILAGLVCFLAENAMKPDCEDSSTELSALSFYE